MDHTVYWIHEDTDTDPYEQGYVGITRRPIGARMTSHKRRNRSNQMVRQALKDGANISILANGLTRDEAGSLERHYRPTPYIGLNKAKGGGGGHIERGYHHSPEVVEKNRQRGIQQWVEDREHLETVVRSNLEKAREACADPVKGKQWREKLSEAGKNVPKVECELCGYWCKPWNMPQHRNGKRCMKMRGIIT